MCSADIWAAFGEQWQGLVPELEHVGLPAAGRRLGPDELARIDIAAFSADLWHSGLAPAFFSICRQSTNLRWLHTFSAGTDDPVMADVHARGVRVTHSAGAAARPLAHSVILQVLALCRNARPWALDQAAKRWDKRFHPDIEGRTMGIIGLGSIGAEVALIAPAFGMRVIGMRRTPRGDEPCETWTIDRLHELLPIVDDLVLTAPLNDDSHHLIGARELALLKPGAHIVNIGRGAVIDEAALVAALQSGQVGGAALDVFEVEPLPADSPLWEMDNVIITPHSAGNTDLAVQRTIDLFTDNLARFIAGEPLHNELT